MMTKVEQMLEDSARKGDGKVNYRGELTAMPPEVLARLAKDYCPPKVIDSADVMADLGKHLGIHRLSPHLAHYAIQLHINLSILEWLDFRCVENSVSVVVLRNEWYCLTLQTNGVRVQKANASGVFRAGSLDCALDHLFHQIDYGTHYIWAAGIAIMPKQHFSPMSAPSKVTKLLKQLIEINAKLAYKSDKCFRWVSKAGEIEITCNNFKSTLTTEEEIPMNIFDLVAANELFEVKVVFKGSAQQYSYKSDVAYEPGTKVVVDSPSSGFVVVTVVSSEKGLSGGNFPKYKWIVGAIDMSRYDELMANEANAIAKLAAFQRAAKAKAELEALGLSAADVLSMLGLASKAE